jgi:hypothetical protein
MWEKSHSLKLAPDTLRCCLSVQSYSFIQSLNKKGLRFSSLIDKLAMNNSGLNDQIITGRVNFKERKIC